MGGERRREGVEDEVGRTIMFTLVNSCLTEALLNIILMQCTRVYFEETSQHNIIIHNLATCTCIVV